MRNLSILLFFCLIFSFKAKADWAAYYPNGKKIEIKFDTIKSLLDSLGINETEQYGHKYGEVFFKRLSNIPLFVFFFEKEYPEKIKEMIESYDYKSYLLSYSYYWDLHNMIDSGSLTKSYLVDVFGKANYILTGGGEDTWVYESKNLKVDFDEDSDIAKEADVVDYNFVKKAQLAIEAFNAIGDKFSLGFEISLLNYSNKVIKYVYITVTAKNPVNDIIGTKTVKAIGPIKFGNVGSYEFENVFFYNSR